MNHNLALLGWPWSAVPRAPSNVEMLIVALVEQGCYAQAESLSLRPAAVRERRIIGRGRCEMPCFVGGVEASAVSLVRVSS